MDGCNKAREAERDGRSHDSMEPPEERPVPSSDVAESSFVNDRSSPVSRQEEKTDEAPPREIALQLSQPQSATECEAMPSHQWDRAEQHSVEFDDETIDNEFTPKRLVRQKTPGPGKIFSGEQLSRHSSDDKSVEFETDLVDNEFTPKRLVRQKTPAPRDFFGTAASCSSLDPTEDVFGDLSEVVAQNSAEKSVGFDETTLDNEFTPKRFTRKGTPGPNKLSQNVSDYWGSSMATQGSTSSIKSVDFDPEALDNEFTPKSLVRQKTPGPKVWKESTDEWNEKAESDMCASDENLDVGRLRLDEYPSSTPSKVRFDLRAKKHPASTILREPTPAPQNLEEQIDEHQKQLRMWGEDPPPREADAAELVADYPE